MILLYIINLQILLLILIINIIVFKTINIILFFINALTKLIFLFITIYKSKIKTKVLLNIISKLFIKI